MLGPVSCRWRRQEPAGLHLDYALFEGPDNVGYIFVAVCGREEQGEIFVNVNPTIAHVVEEQAREFELGWKAEICNRSEILQPDRHSTVLQKFVQLGGH